MKKLKITKAKENLRVNKIVLENQLKRWQRQEKLLDINIEYGLAPTEADLHSLS